ncbi:MAG: tetratricopeptide repeat-containing sensor histidine kinase [Mariniphaga sp.]
MGKYPRLCHSISGLILLTIAYSCQQPANYQQITQTAQEIDSLIHRTYLPGSVSMDSSFIEANKALTLSRIARNDTLIIKSWFALGSILRLEGKNDEAFQLFQNASQLSAQIHYVNGSCQSLIESGSIFYIRGAYEKSGELFSKALVMSQLNHFDDLEAAALNFMGKYLHTTGRFDESVLFYKRAIEIFKRRGDLMQSASVLLSLGKTYSNDGNLFMALRCYLEAYETCNKTKDYINLADVCNHLGSIYLALDKTAKSMEYHRKALFYRLSLKTPEGLANSYNNIGKVFLAKNNPDSAQFYFLKALSNCEQISYTKGRVKALTNLGKVFNLRLEPLKAKPYLLKSLDISHNSGYDEGMAEASLEMGNTLISLNQPDSARQLFEQCLHNAKLANLTGLYHDCYLGLYRFYLAKGYYSNALDYYKLFAEADKKLTKSENNQQLSELRLSFESEIKEKDNELLRNDNEFKKKTILRKDAFILMVVIALSISALFAILFYTLFETKKKAHRKLAKLNEKVLRQNAELEKLNKELENANREKDKVFSIITHELRNPLYWFQNLTEMLSVKYTNMSSEMVRKTLGALDESAKNAFHLMDNLLHWSRSRLNRITPVITDHSLENLINESSRMYETILNQKNIPLGVKLPENALIKADADLFMCVMRNLISNAIKFTPEGGTIEINALQVNLNYVISVIDTGLGMDAKQKQTMFNSDVQTTSLGLMNEKGSGFGLKLCKEFVEMNGGKIWITDNRVNGSCFSFTIPAAIQHT